jgi:hypothetical protein
LNDNFYGNNVIINHKNQDDDNTPLYVLYIQENLINPSPNEYAYIYRTLLLDIPIYVNALRKIIKYFYTLNINEIEHDNINLIYEGFISLIVEVPGPNPNKELDKLITDALDIHLKIIDAHPNLEENFISFFKEEFPDYYIDTLFKLLDTDKIKRYYYGIKNFDTLINISIKCGIKINLDNTNEILLILNNRNENGGLIPPDSYALRANEGAMVMLYDYIINNYKLNNSIIDILIKGTYDFIIEIYENKDSFYGVNTVLMTQIINKLCNL